VSVLVGTVAGVFALRGDDGPVRETEGPVSALAPDPDGTCWGVLDRQTLIRRELDGSWVPVPAGVDRPITAVHPTGFGALVGTADARLWAVVRGDAAPVTGFDTVAGRDGWHAVGSARPYVRSVSSTVGDGALLA
jgi:hypothetical protein